MAVVPANPDIVRVNGCFSQKPKKSTATKVAEASSMCAINGRKTIGVVNSARVSLELFQNFGRYLKIRYNEVDTIRVNNKIIGKLHKLAN